jgi:hypothetical protein
MNIVDEDGFRLDFSPLAALEAATATEPAMNSRLEIIYPLSTRRKMDANGAT